MIVSTLFMTGLIWFVQVVHYPLFQKVGVEAFKTYETLHTIRTGWVVMPVMVLELFSTLALLFYRPASIPPVIVTILVVLTIGIWLSTAFVQVPLHNKLVQDFDSAAINKLVNSNWIRTMLWSIKSLLCLWILQK